MTMQAQATVSLGTAADFGLLAASTITNTGDTVISGNIGVFPGSAITGFFGTATNDGPGIFSGSVHQADSTADQAQQDALAAYNNLTGLPVTTTLGVELAGLTLTPGVYLLGSAELTGTLTLDGIGDYVFQINNTLTTASSSGVSLLNGAEASHVFWAVGSAATFGEETDFAGTIIASSSVSLTNGATVDGRIISLNGAITLINNTVIPEPSSASLLAILSLGLIARRRRAAR